MVCRKLVKQLKVSLRNRQSKYVHLKLYIRLGALAVQATQEAEAGRSLERRGSKPGWSTYRDPISEEESECMSPRLVGSCDTV